MFVWLHVFCMSSFHCHCVCNFSSFFPLFSAFFLFSLKLCIKVGGVWGGGPNNFGFLGDISNFKLKLHYFVST